MADDDVSVSIGADLAPLQQGADMGAHVLQQLAEPVVALKNVFEDLEAGVKKSFDFILSEATDVAKEMTSIIADAGRMSLDFTKVAAIIGGGGVAAALAAAFGFLSKVDEKMKNLVDSSERANLSIARYQQLAYAASLRGVGSSDFNDAVKKSADLIDEMGRKENDFSKLLDENNIKWKDTHGVTLNVSSAMLKVADMVKQAANYSQAVKIADWAGYSEKMVPFLRQGSEAIRKMAEDAPIVSDELAKQRKQFAEEWEKTLAQWTEWFQTAIIKITPMLQKLVDGATAIAKAIGSVVWSDLKQASDAFTANEEVSRRFTFNIESATKAGEKLKTVAAETADAWKDVGTKTTKLKPEDDKKKGHDEVEIARMATEEKIKIANLEYDQVKEKLQARVKLHEITYGEETRALLVALDQRQKAELKALDDELKISGLSKTEKQRIENEKTTILKKAELDRLKIVDQGIEEEAKHWQKMLDTIQGAFNSQLRGLLAGTTSWQQAMKSILGDLIIKFIEYEEKTLFEHIATELAKTTATTTGVAARTAAETAGATTSILAQIGNAFAVIMADAAKTFAGVFAFLAPVMGPAASGPATASAAAVTASAAVLPAADVGGFVVSSGLAQIHAGETIVPATIQQPFGSVGPGSAGASAFRGGDVNINISQFVGSQAFINSLMPQLLKAMKQYKNINPSTA